MDKTIIAIYKEVGKEPVFIKLKNSIESFENYLEGKVEFIPYEDIYIICKKDRERLNPSIYLNVSFGKFDCNIRGNILLIARDSKGFTSLNREQAIKYAKFLIRESFSYKHFDENGKYLSNKQLRKRRKLKKTLENQDCNIKGTNVETTSLPTRDSIINKIASIPEVTVVKKDDNKGTFLNINNSISNASDDEDDDNINTKSAIQMILKMQSAILEFIQEYNKNN